MRKFERREKEAFEEVLENLLEKCNYWGQMDEALTRHLA